MSLTRKRKADKADPTDDRHGENTSSDSRVTKHSPIAAYHTPPSSRSPLRAVQGSGRTAPPSMKQDIGTSPQPPRTADKAASSVTLTPDSDDDDVYDNRQLYGILHTSIVGIRFYTSDAAVGEYVLIRREPHNSYDRNAIRIDNLRRQQMGHLTRDTAARLAPLMDSGELIVEGVLTATKSEFQRPLGLKLFGTARHPEKWALRVQMLKNDLPVQVLDRTEATRQRRQLAYKRRRLVSVEAGTET